MTKDTKDAVAGLLICMSTFICGAGVATVVNSIAAKKHYDYVNEHNAKIRDGFKGLIELMDSINKEHAEKEEEA